MSRSNKARYSQRLSLWKDTVFGSRSQKRAWAKRKQIRSQAERTQRKQDLHKESKEA